MASRQRTQSESRKRVPKVRIARPAGRPFQLRYTCPTTGEQVRLSTGGRDDAEAERQRAEAQAKLTLGIDPRSVRERMQAQGANMPWEDFRHEYTRLKVSTFRSDNAKDTAEVRLDVCEAIIRPRTLGEMAKPTTLARLQVELRAGSHSRVNKQRSPRTVESYVRTLQAALNWGHKMGWLDKPVVIDLKVDDDSAELKGRPLTDAEFQAMLEACETVCPKSPESWQFLLRGLLESGLRIGEAMNLSWDDDSRITPLRTRGGGYLLRIPARMQKSRKGQTIPTTPGFASVVDEIEHERRTGWVFNPAPLGHSQRRLSKRWVEKVISKIGKAAGVVVSDNGKPASAHDLRRTFGQRMADAGLPPRDLQAIMRHESLATTEKYYLRHRATEQAERIARILSLGTLAGYTPPEPPEATTTEGDVTPCPTTSAGGPGRTGTPEGTGT